MKTPLLLALLLGLVYYYYHESPVPKPAVEKAVPAQPVSHPVAAQAVIIAAAPSSYDRWQTGPSAQTRLKTGPNAQTNLKAGPNAQTDFAPFSPSEQATWNQSPGYTIVAGRYPRTR